MDGAKVGVLEQSHQVALSCLLQGHDCRALETKVSLVILSDLADEALERELTDEKLGRLLILADLTAQRRSVLADSPWKARNRQPGTTNGGAISSHFAQRTLQIYNAYGDVPQRDGTRAVAVGLLDTTRRGRAFASGLGGQLLAGRLATGRLASCLLRTGHILCFCNQQR